MNSLPIKPSKTEAKIISILETYPRVYVAELAKIIFKNVPIAKRPKVPGNSVTSAIRQINRKLEKVGNPWRIGGEGRGPKGKLIYWVVI